MCILAFSLNNNADYPFVMIDNRDEHINRLTNHPNVELFQHFLYKFNLPQQLVDTMQQQINPTSNATTIEIKSSAEVLETKSELYHNIDILSGSDARAGGTWCGFNVKSGVFVGLTNYFVNETNPSALKYTSRGLLVKHLLMNESLPELEQLNKTPLDSTTIPTQYLFEGFSLLYCNLYAKLPLRCYYASPHQFAANSVRIPISNQINTIPQNHKPTSDIYAQSVSPGVHCFSNSHFNDESWPKVKTLRANLLNIVEGKFKSSSTTKFPDYSVDNLMEDLSSILTDSSAIDFSLLYDHLISHDCCAQHKHLSYGAIFRPATHFIWPTRSQTMIIYSKRDSAIYYCYRNTDSVQIKDNELILPEWIKFKISLPCTS
jgi:uncharacterized protein with NRDE domain